MEKGVPIDQHYAESQQYQNNFAPPPYQQQLPMGDQGQYSGGGYAQPQQPQSQDGFSQPLGFKQPPVYAHPPISVQPIGIQVVQVSNLGSRSARMACPHCGADIQTRVKHNPGTMTHLAAILICLVFFPCVCIPYCIDDCMDAEHDCPNCDRHIGIHKKM